MAAKMVARFYDTHCPSWLHASNTMLYGRTHGYSPPLMMMMMMMMTDDDDCPLITHQKNSIRSMLVAQGRMDI